MREQLTALGIELDQRVRVRLVEAIHLPDGTAATGLTQECEQSRTVAGIEVVRGLTSVHFGATVAHEIGHAWLIQRGAPITGPVLLEGVCEVFASAWLKRQPGRLPAALREAMAANPDNVYGTGYRLVRAAVERSGIRAVLQELCRSGRLP
ncbi:protein DA1 [Amycolatopsis sp. NPDC051045]|uniref:protein DA1 n=1 Tax=Amycolatopsis sp. NPDC051045 TaxID=3156922 RepID=UPI00341F5813